MVEATVGVRIKTEGAGELKARLQELRQEFQNGDISVSEYSKGIREVNRDARALGQTSQVNTNIWRVQYPVINNLTRSMSAIGSISRTALTSITAFATIRTAFNTANSNLMELKSQLAEAERNTKKFADAGKEIDAKDWEEKARTIRQQIKETNDSMAQDKISASKNGAPPGFERLGPRLLRNIQSGAFVAGAAGLNTMVNRPTLFLAGEAGRQEHVQIGNTSGVGGNGAIINNITIQGSVWQRDNLVDEIDKQLKRRFKQRGFRG